MTSPSAPGVVDAQAMLQALYDRQKIHEVVTRYCRAVDRMDRELLLSCYHPDAIDDHGFFVGGPEAFWDWVQHYNGHAQSSHQHIITNHSCELEGDTAHTETYWMFAAMDAEDASLSLGGGRYIDRLEKRDGQWRIAARKCVGDWGGVPAPSKVPVEFMAVLQGGAVVARDRSDASFDRPPVINPQRIGLNHSILPPGYEPH